MGDCKKITNTAKEMVVNVRDGSKTAVSTFKEISANLKTVSLATEAPLKWFEVELKGLGEGCVSDPSLFVYNGDNTRTLEVFSKLLGKPIAELSSATEVLRINAAKVFSEIRTASDSLLLVVDWVRKIDDSPQSQFANKDILSVSLVKSLLEQEFVTDTVAKSFATSFLDSNAATDMVATTVQTPKQDAFAASDSITFLVDFRPIIQDWVYSTDDVLGSANIDDDQYMRFNKVTIDSSTSSEELSSTLNKIMLGAAADGMGDSQSVSDVFEKSLGVVYNSDYFLYDYVQEDYLLTRSWTHDIITLNLNKQANDTGITIDTVIREVSFHRLFSDTATSASVALISISKELNDNTSSIDAIAKSAGVLLADSVGAPDVLRKSLTASKADTAAMLDACTANLQDYMSALYVDAGYIGVNYAL